VDDGRDEQPVRRRHPYTWLHLIVLALVAFVLGFLIMALWNQGKSNGAEGASGAAAVVMVAPPGSSSAA
jgi:flagellar basal body-associated protein FliL